MYTRRQQQYELEVSSLHQLMHSQSGQNALWHVQLWPHQPGGLQQGYAQAA